MPSDHMERILVTPLVSPTFAEPSAVFTASCQYLQREDAGSMGSEISESGWTMYLDQSINSWRDKITTSGFDFEKQQKKNLKFTQNVERYLTYDDQASGISGNEEDSSMASDASSGPQKMPLPLPAEDIQFDEDRQVAGSYSLDSRRKLPLPVEDIQFGEDRQVAGSYSLDSRRKRGADDRHGDLECVASCSLVDLSFTRKKSRKVNKKVDEHEVAPWLQDTASSPILRPEVQEVNTRFEVLQPLLHDGEKMGKERCGRAIEYTNSRDE